MMGQVAAVLRASFLCASGMAHAAGGFAADAGSPVPVRAHRLEVRREPSQQEGGQFLQRDKKGRLHLLRGDRLEVARRDRTGLLVFSDRLRGPGESVAELPFVLDAAASGDASEWLLLEGSLALRLYQGGREQSLPDLPWMAMNVGFLSGAPAAAVAPAQQASGSRAAQLVRPEPLAGEDPPPLIVKLEDGKWETVVEGEWPEQISARRTAVSELRARGDVRFCATAKGETRVAWMNRYRVRFFDRGGRLDLEIKSGVQDLEWVPLEAKETLAIREVAPNFDPKRVAPERPQQKIAQIACAEDGTMYLLAWTAAGVALDRFDPSGPDERVERVAVDGLDFPKGRVSMVASGDGLSIAPFNPEHGIWQIPWEELASADWRPVSGVTIERQPPVGAMREPGSKPIP
jgi:hypothetical protein